MGRGRFLIAAGVAALVALAVGATPAAAAGLRAGAGRADIEPPTGYYMMGWVRADAKITGQHTRLFARALVLEQGGRKLALVTEDLNGIPGGMVEDAINLVKDRGFSDQNVIVSASHTHAAQSGYYNFGTYNTIFPSMATLTNPDTVSDFKITNTAADPVLYGMMVRQLAAAIRRADDNLAPAAAGWSEMDLVGLTENRSIEAHLADHGIIKPYGTGSAKDDPDGYVHTIDPEVNVLRVDKVKGRRRVPIGIWSTFADHGTVNQYTFKYFNADHHGSATRIVEARIRKAGHVPKTQDVVNAYGNTDEGDQSAGLHRNGPDVADWVGRVEAHRMLTAWKRAGRSMSRKPPLDSRWTRFCFCGQQTEGGAVDSTASLGLAEFTGSEEGRGPLYDETGVPFEGRTSPVDAGAQSHKLQIVRDQTGGTPNVAPILAARVGDRMIVTVPGEMTADMGRRVRASVLAATQSAGIKRAVISGLANEYISYFTTPEEFDQQHYEGAATLYGKYSSNLIKEQLTDLSSKLVGGQAAPAPYPFDPVNGVKASSEPFGKDASSATGITQPDSVHRLEHAKFSWQGAPRGFDRPLDRAFVRIERLSRKRSKVVADDLGLQILWSVTGDGTYTAQWEVPLTATPGRYRFVVSANHYEIASSPFAVGPSVVLKPQLATSTPGKVTLTLDYPDAVHERDYTFRPQHAQGGKVVYEVNGRKKVVRRRGRAFALTGPAGATVTIPPGGAADRFGNRNGDAFSFSP